LSPAQQKVIDALGVKVMAVTHKQINWAQVEPQLIEAYRNTFTQREIDGMLDYYRSPAGQANLPSSRACSSRACSSCSSG
jgi:hypothetical protein